MQNQSVGEKNMEEANLVNRYGHTTMWSPQSSSPLLLPSSSIELSSPSDGAALSSTRLPASAGPSTSSYTSHLSANHGFGGKSKLFSQAANFAASHISRRASLSSLATSQRCGRLQSWL